MINDTPHPILLTDNLPGALRTALAEFERFLLWSIGDEEDASRSSKRYYRVTEIFRPDLVSASVDVDFLIALHQLCLRNQNAYPSGLLDCVYRGSRSTLRLSADKLKHLRRLARFVLYTLWSDGHIVMPITFSVSKAFNREQLAFMAPETACFCFDFPIEASVGSSHFRMTQHAPRWLCCTSWLTPEDVEIEEAVALNKFLLTCHKGTAGFPAPAVSPCVRLFLAELRKAFGERTQYSDADIARFDLLFSNRLYEQVSLADVEAAVEERHRLAKEAGERKAAKRAKHLRDQKERNATVAEFYSGETDALLDDEDVVHLVYKSRYERLGWFADVSKLSFLSRRFPSEGVEMWSRLFDNYLVNRIENERYEALKPAQGALRVLADYLAICLPVYYESATRMRTGSGEHGTAAHGSGATQLEILPTAPKHFRRFPFIDNRRDPQFGAPTLLSYVSHRCNSRNSQYAHLNQIRKFFGYIERNYSDSASADIAGPSYQNPLSQELDLPRVPGRKHQTTDKIPFSKHVVPHLLSWLYAIEAFGIYLQHSDIPFPYRNMHFDTTEFGYVPFYRHLGRIHAVVSIPVSLLWPAPGTRVPSMACLRMIIAALELGLRFQSLQWLCRLSFDKLNKGKGDHDVYFLWVNTDKTNDGFVAPILKRVRDLLLREKADQERLSASEELIYYEGRRHTRFEKLLPLFRNPETNKPYTDTTYHRGWVVALDAFQAFYGSHLGFVEFVRLEAPKEPTVECTKDGHEFCPLRVRALYTPHSCRSTFVTRRSPFLDLADLADVIGHSSSAVTAHYNYPEHDSLSAKLMFADAAVMEERPDPAPISGGPAFIKASEQNSALQAAFRTDRAATIAQFGVMSLRKGLSEDETNAIDLLQASPLSQIVFRDTHICPVGENCPEEVIRVVGAPRRCGGCPLGCKSVDHLPAIAAKVRHLAERIETNKRTYRRLQDRGASEGDLAELYDMIEADTQELLAWKLSEEVLWDIKAQFPETPNEHIHVAEPELVRMHLERVVKVSSEQEFLLRRIIEANEYPTMASDRLCLRANKLKRRIMADCGMDASDVLDGEEVDDIDIVASLVRTIMKAKNLTLEALADAVSSQAPLPISGLLLLEDHSGGPPTDARS